MGGPESASNLPNLGWIFKYSSDIFKKGGGGLGVDVILVLAGG